MILSLFCLLQRLLQIAVPQGTSNARHVDTLARLRVERYQLKKARHKHDQPMMAQLPTMR